MSKVAVLKTRPETVIQDYKTLLELIEYDKILEKKKEVLLKLNLSWSLYFPSCSTQPWQLDGVLDVLTKDYRILPVENKTVVTDPQKGIEKNKWLSIFKKYGLKFCSLTDVTWVKYNPVHKTPALDEIFPEGFEIPEMFKGTQIVHLPTVKTHGHTVTTGAVKNAFGGLLKEHRHHAHKLIHEVLVDLMKIQKEIHPSVCAVMDGTVCGDGAGPRTMIPKCKGFILASDDLVAIDAVAAKLMGFDPLSIHYIRKAHEEHLGTGDVGNIEIVGEDISDINFRFQSRKSPVIFWDQMFRQKKLSFLEKVIFHTPLFKVPILLSKVYHDYIWYTTVGRKRIADFSKTEWGKLFEEY